ncbi:MAG: Ger(x)C family spore germination protein [Xylanivirga thermophila]|jgi:Ger(x)C family germination protein|uniref:Ger(x)C family spore germination protein n=2 Tax=Xylanivirga thermophila TaxID=2496273 RepID=UPI00101BEAFB
MFRRVTIFMLIFFICIFVTTGCWDNIEIEKNAFILGIALDADPKNADNIVVTYQIALPDAMQGGSEGGGGANGEESTINLSINAKNLKDAEQRLISYIDRRPNYEHMQIVILGEELSRAGIANHIDFFFRNPQSRRLTQLLVSKGAAKKIMEFKPKTTKSTSQYLASIVKYGSKNSINITSFLNMALLEENILRTSDFAMAMVANTNGKLSVEGAGIFKKGNLIGWLEPRDIIAIKMLRNEKVSGNLNLPMFNKNAGQVSVQIMSSKTKTIPAIKDDKIYFDITIDIEEDIAAIEGVHFSSFDQKFMHEVERQTEKEVKNICMRVFNNIHDKYQADIFELDHKVANYYPEAWDQIKPRWDEIYRNSIELNIKVHAKVRRIGLIK